MLPLTVLRRFDCVLAPTKGAVLDAHARHKDRLHGCTARRWTAC
jgi:type I restriction enzyme M protein